MTEEVWTPIPDFPGYEASTHGRIRSFWSRAPGGGANTFYVRPYTHKILKELIDKWGRPYVSLRRDRKTHRVSVYRTILLTFVGPCPPGREACHYDDNPRNNCVSNLRWDTHGANYADKIRNGGIAAFRPGSDHRNAKLWGDAVRAIRAEPVGLGATKMLSERFGVSASYICNIRSGRGWEHVKEFPDRADEGVVYA